MPAAPQGGGLGRGRRGTPPLPGGRSAQTQAAGMRGKEHVRYPLSASPGAAARRLWSSARPWASGLLPLLQHSRSGGVRAASAPEAGPSYGADGVGGLGAGVAPARGDRRRPHVWDRSQADVTC